MNETNLKQQIEEINLGSILDYLHDNPHKKFIAGDPCSCPVAKYIQDKFHVIVKVFYFGAKIDNNYVYPTMEMKNFIMWFDSNFCGVVTGQHIYDVYIARQGK